MGVCAVGGIESAAWHGAACDSADHRGVVEESVVARESDLQGVTVDEGSVVTHSEGVDRVGQIGLVHIS